MRLRSLVLALAATLIVTVVPVAVVWLLRDEALIDSALVGVLLAVAVSLGIAWLAEFTWSRRPEANDAVFSELLIWGWLRRIRAERRLARAEELLEELEVGHQGPVSIRRSERLLGQLVTALEAQDAYLNGHSRRVARHATMIARQMGLPRGEIRRVRAAAAIHDVGKLNVPLDVLNKPGRLTEEEFDLIRRHPVDGEAIVSGLGDPDLDSIVRHHHERLDGRGYPDGWSGEMIPLGARIVAVADTFDAVTSTRPYRGAAPQRQALKILREVSGTQLDPDAVQAFLRYYAGRRPITLFATLASWFGMRWQRTSSALGAGPVSAAKIALLSAVVGFGGYSIAHSSGPSSAADAAALPPQTAPSVASGFNAEAVKALRINPLARRATRHRVSPAPARQPAHHRRSRRPAGRLVLSTASPPASLPGGATHPGSSSSTPGGGSGAGNSSGGSSAGSSTSAPVVSQPTTAPTSPVSGSPNESAPSGGGNTGSQGLAHGQGPGGNGPPGLTGQNPGLGGAPPPGQAKKH